MDYNESLGDVHGYKFFDETHYDPDWDWFEGTLSNIASYIYTHKDWFKVLIVDGGDNAICEAYNGFLTQFGEHYQQYNRQITGILLDIQEGQADPSVIEYKGGSIRD